MPREKGDNSERKVAFSRKEFLAPRLHEHEDPFMKIGRLLNKHNPFGSKLPITIDQMEKMIGDKRMP